MNRQAAALPATAGRPARPLPVLPEQPASIPTIAAWFALLTGLGEVAGLAVMKFFLRRYLPFGLQVVWMAPLADLVIFEVVAIGLVLAARRWPRVASLRAVVFTFAFLGFASLLFMVAGLHRVAALALAAGLAVQTARLAAAHPPRFYALIRFSLGWAGAFSTRRARLDPDDISLVNTGVAVSRREFLLGAGATLAGLVAGAQGWPALAERSALAKLPPAPAGGAPNVLLVVLDTVRAQSVSLHGYARPTTPRLERLARRGVRFERALAPAPWTLASHASIFTGRHPHELSVGWRRPLDGAYPTLAEALSAQGYVTAGFIANTIYCSTESGLNRGFAHYEDYLITPGEIARSSSLGRTVVESNRLRRVVNYHERIGRKSAERLNRDLLRWLAAGRQDRRPFFVFLNYFDAHSPYFPPAPFDAMFAPRTRRSNPMLDEGWQWSPQEVQAEQDAYDGAVAYLDHQVGLLFDELERGGWLENTLAIITSDHGEEFYEHGLMSHGSSLYLPALHVPLVISCPARMPAGASVAAPVALRDLPATVLDLLEIKDETYIPGNSLAQYWEGARRSDDLAAEPLLSELAGSDTGGSEWKGAIRSLVADGKHYILNGDGHEELYDWDGDPWEQRDLASSEPGRQALEQFRASLGSR